MKEYWKNIKKVYNAFSVSFSQNSFFYKASLDTRSSIFATERFIPDSWPGTQSAGSNILNGIVFSELSDVPLSLVELIIYSPVCNGFEDAAKYANSFFWLRDLQAIGGNSARKYARKLIAAFIESYRDEKRFWTRDFQWAPEVIGERICSWIFSYSFVASGADDDFQKEMLSSLCEQYSHLLKSYRAETDNYLKIIALKAIMFCKCFSANIDRRSLRKFASRLDNCITEIFDKNGMLLTRNPVDYFNLFRSLVEIKFALKGGPIELKSFENLPNMAACIRMLRMGDGRISEFQGDIEPQKSFIIPTRSIVDAAISVIDASSSNVNLPTSFSRISTKEITIIVNNKISNVKSKFNDFNKPGINIFDFESSFGINKLISRADISIIFNKFRVKITKNSENFYKIFNKNGGLLYTGFLQSNSFGLPLVVEREIFVSLSEPKMKGIDYIRIPSDFIIFSRFVFNKKCEINKPTQKSIIINLGQNKYKLSSIFKQNSNNIAVINKSKLLYPAVEIGVRSEAEQEVRIDWEIGKMEG
ncbi:hypothetical protein FACS1894113_0480 [Alphaproteobacteria bacterium]|nr:hypothetical protein FACS1894113_0480 [Alphaproteobacteria bacterium]